LPLIFPILPRLSFIGLFLPTPKKRGDFRLRHRFCSYNAVGIDYKKSFMVETQRLFGEKGINGYTRIFYASKRTSNTRSNRAIHKDD
jgi:hypothetical protein